MITKIYRYKIAAGKWRDFVELQKRADTIYRKHVDYEVSHVKNDQDASRITEIHRYKSRKDEETASNLHEIEPELKSLFHAFMEMLDPADSRVTEEVGEDIPLRAP